MKRDEPLALAPIEGDAPGLFMRRANTLSAAFMRRRGAVLLLSLVSLCAIALADLWTGYELALSLLYVAPVLAATWALGLAAGLAVSLLATGAWLATDALAEHHYSLAAYRYWEGFIRLATFSLFALMLDQLRRALARSDARLLKVLEGLDAAIGVIEPVAGDLLYRNRRFDVAFPGAGRSRAARSLFDTALALPSGAEASAELALEGRWFLVRGRWLLWTDERPVLLVSATDVTARRSAEALNREHEARLQASSRLAAVGEIASSIAHELNQPLAAIASYVAGCVRRLRAGPTDAAALAGALEQAGEQAERAGRIIRRVRDFVGSRQPALAVLELNALVERAAGIAAREPGRVGARVVLGLAPGLPAALGDAVMLEQVVLNLVRNALDAAPEQPVEVRTGTGEGEGTLLVSVADRGPGIAADAAARLFEPFFTSKPEGLGLGLNICRSIVEFHGGHLSVRGRAGGGADFRFTLRAAVP
jgi:signal transduction histidine kinase